MSWCRKGSCWGNGGAEGEEAPTNVTFDKENVQLGVESEERAQERDWRQGAVKGWMQGKEEVCNGHSFEEQKEKKNEDLKLRMREMGR